MTLTLVSLVSNAFPDRLQQQVLHMYMYYICMYVQVLHSSVYVHVCISKCLYNCTEKSKYQLIGMFSKEDRKTV